MTVCGLRFSVNVGRALPAAQKEFLFGGMGCAFPPYMKIINNIDHMYWRAVPALHEKLTA
jgi:hypothetical protein